MKISAKLIKTANILLCILIFMICYIHIYHKIAEENIIDKSYISFCKTAISYSYLLIILVFFMMFINWGLEAFKMQLLLRRIQPLSLMNALKMVITGISFSFLFPNRYGEFIGRGFAAKSQKFQVGLTGLIASLAQTLITLCCGLGALFYILFQYDVSKILHLSIVLITSCITVFCFFIYFKLPLLQRLCSKVKWTFLQKYIQRMSILNHFSKQELLKILLLSFVRYSVFALQFYLILHIFNLNVSLTEALFLIPIYYLMLMIIPVFFITEPGVRGSVAIFLLSWLHPNSSTSIFMATTVIWSINILIPAIIGSFFLLHLKLISHD